MTGIVDIYRVAKELYQIAKDDFRDIEVWTDDTDLYVVISFSSEETANEVAKRLKVILNWLFGKRSKSGK
ncbi:MAG: hypothetical protein J7L51_00655 [Desulfurococcales archaeon]|nr:hypothetical protein [Desulfurococcales archaeon]